jgi:hypothetical protein
VLLRKIVGRTIYYNKRFNMVRTFAMMLAVPVLLLVATRATAQTVVYVQPSYCPPVASYYAPAVSYYAPPSVSNYSPPTVSYYAAPAVSYYPTVTNYAPAVSYYAAPTVSYYTPAYAAPVTTYYRYGLFGRRIGAVTYYP